MSALTLALSAAEEAHADDALLALHKLQLMLVRRDATGAASMIDDAMDKIIAAARRPTLTGDPA